MGFCEAVGIKAYGHERITTLIGCRGKPVQKLRLIRAEDAHAMARHFQGQKGTTVSFIGATPGGLPAGFLSAEAGSGGV